MNVTDSFRILVMHPDLSPNLHTDECNKLIQQLFDCRTENSFGKFFGKCNSEYSAMLRCMKGERQERRDANAKKARARQAEIRERVKNDKTDYDELLKRYRKSQLN